MDALTPTAAGPASRRRSDRGARPSGTSRLVRENLAYVPSVARRYLGFGMALDELVAAGNLGLVEAALRFDPERKVRFVTYADWWIRKAILESLEEQSGPVRLPRYQYERVRIAQQARANWLLRHGEEPTRAELARAAGLSEAAIHRLLHRIPTSTSLDQPFGPDGERPLKDTLADERRESPQTFAVRRDLAGRLMRQLESLEQRELVVILLRFGLGGEPALTLRDTGRRLNISRERVRQLELRALLKLQRLL